MPDESADLDNAGATIVVLAMAVGLWMVLVNALNGHGAAAAPAGRRGPDVFEWLALAAGLAIQCVSVVILLRLSRALRAAAAVAVVAVVFGGGSLLPTMVEPASRYGSVLGGAWIAWLVVLFGIAARGVRRAARS